ncbi:MAG: tRNA pseudouridine(38-40) synthase TruA [Ginsengibacter sp.]
MARFFVEVAYDGTRYSGFQKQDNAVTIQSEVEQALLTYYRKTYDLTGASRTDAGVHAYQNFFHFDDESSIYNDKDLYHLNRILPLDIVIKNLFQVTDDRHCRFDAVSRQYEYVITNKKDPFLTGKAFYFPYNLDVEKLNDSCNILLMHKNFESFSKKNNQVFTYNCDLFLAIWTYSNNKLLFNISGSRFLRGMVRGVVGTMLKVGTGKISLQDFEDIILAKDCARANFAVRPWGLYLKGITYSAG